MCQHNSTEKILKLIIIFVGIFLIKKYPVFIIFYDKIGSKYHFLSLHNMSNQFDGSNVFSGHIRQRFHLLSLSQPGKAISAGNLVRVG